MKNKNITALIWQGNNWYIARSLEVEVANQGQTRQEAVNNLKEALELYFEEPNHSSTPTVIQKPTIETIQLSYA